jgi:hypothetical protein
MRKEKIFSFHIKEKMKTINESQVYLQQNWLHYSWQWDIEKDIEEWVPLKVELLSVRQTNVHNCLVFEVRLS